jgi:uncharacterized protein
MTLSNTEKIRLKDKYGTWAVVTGASSGIGLELATQLASAGLNLILNARRQSELEKIAADFEKTFGIQTRLAVGDLGTEGGITTVRDTAKGLNVGLFVASAGFGTSGRFIKNDLADEVAMLRVNCEALMILTHHFGRLFAQNKRGGIILLSSLVGFQGVPNAAHYAATKAYVQSLSEALAHELRPYNVDVLAAAPGPVTSGFGNRADMNMEGAATTDKVGVPILMALGRTDTVAPGFLSKLLSYSLMTVPRWGKVRIMKMVMSGMTKHQH